MRSLKPFFRFLLQVQGAIVQGARINREEDSVEILVRRHEFVPWAEARVRHTKVFDRHVASLAQVADRSAAARMFHVAWRTVGRMVRRVVDRFLPPDLLEDLEFIGVDETSYKRGHRYLTVVTNLVTGVVVWVGKGKTAETLGEFFKLLGPERASKIALVTMDMGEAYQKAVKEWAPNADVVFDRFHVVKLLLEAIDEIRREECRALEGEEKKALKNTRYAMQRNPKHRTPKDEDAIKRVKSTVRKNIQGILGFMRWEGITNANLEGMANKIKLCIHKAFGFHSVSALIGMIHLCCSGIDLD